MEETDRRVLGQPREQPLAHARLEREALGLRELRQEAVPALARRRRTAPDRRGRRTSRASRRGGSPASARIACAPASCSVSRRELRAPLARTESQHVAVELRHHEVRAAEPLELVAAPFHRAVRHVVPSSAFSAHDLAQHVGGAPPLHVRRRDAQEPRLARAAALRREAVREAGVPGHLVHFADLRRGIAVLRAHERPEPVFELVELHPMTLARISRAWCGDSSAQLFAMTCALRSC